MPRPTWRITIQGEVHLVSDTNGRIVAEGSGPLPNLEALTVIFPPPEPPPIGTTMPPEDTSPFVWPPQPGYRPYRPEERYAGLGEGFYAGQNIFQNPVPGANLFAGSIVQGRDGSWDLAGYDLWAPAGAKPELIRRMLKVGHA